MAKITHKYFFYICFLNKRRIFGNCIIIGQPELEPTSNNNFQETGPSRMTTNRGCTAPLADVRNGGSEA